MQHYHSDQIRGSANVAETKAGPSLLRAAFTDFVMSTWDTANGISAWLLFWEKDVGGVCWSLFCGEVSHEFLVRVGADRKRNKNPSKDAVWEHTPLESSCESKFRV